MKTATAISPANIAFIKFWGKQNAKLNIPYTDSFSMNLDHCTVTTTVSYDPKLKSDRLTINGKAMDQTKTERVSHILGLVRKMAHLTDHAQITSEINFPSDAGVASSAAAFSALALSASTAAGLKLTPHQLSALSRLGSGSACRSTVDGFGWWKKGHDDKSSYAVKLAGPDYWDLTDIVTVVSNSAKKQSSGEGHSLAKTSPFFATRLKILKKRIPLIKKSFLNRDFKTFGEAVEAEAVELHLIAMSSQPPIYYWNGGTLVVMAAVRELREQGTLCYTTIDAGPNVHVICESKDAKKIETRLKKLPEVISTISNRAGQGTRLLPSR